MGYGLSPPPYLAPFAHKYVPGVGVRLEVAVAEDHVAVGGGQVLQNTPGAQRQQRVCEEKVV